MRKLRRWGFIKHFSTKKIRRRCQQLKPQLIAMEIVKWHLTQIKLIQIEQTNNAAWVVQTTSHCVVFAESL